MATPTMHVTAGVIEHEGRVLVTRRPPGDALGGFWEFPGGKIEPGESPQDCLSRELREELGIATEIGPHLGSAVHRYPDRTVHLSAFRVRYLGGRIVLREHDCFRWALPAEMDFSEFSPADRFIIEMVQNTIDFST